MKTENTVLIKCENGHEELRHFNGCSLEWVEGWCAHYNEQEEPCGVCGKVKTAEVKKD